MQKRKDVRRKQAKDTEKAEEKQVRKERKADVKQTVHRKYEEAVVAYEEAQKWLDSRELEKHGELLQDRHDRQTMEYMQRIVKKKKLLANQKKTTVSGEFYAKGKKTNLSVEVEVNAEVPNWMLDDE
ncbi:MAG: hypothetical protein KVP17_002432 [Porospora cf. gigantea B]|uniref:uncharacterized protein n=1 Tax=Porospora cf. gigantea B TaxID=2853592 RepID=UPI003571C0D1|nr:MAG: hypothetical protein KVP17_002432 [Porospora cf. gigantea B]